MLCNLPSLSWKQYKLPKNRIFPAAFPAEFVMNHTRKFLRSNDAGIGEGQESGRRIKTILAQTIAHRKSAFQVKSGGFGNAARWRVQSSTRIRSSLAISSRCFFTTSMGILPSMFDKPIRCPRAAYTSLSGGTTPRSVKKL
jgi:hypothetical protein